MRCDGTVVVCLHHPLVGAAITAVVASPRALLLLAAIDVN